MFCRGGDGLEKQMQNLQNKSHAGKKGKNKMVILISYDLNGREQPSAYSAAEAVIKSNASNYVKPLYSQWLVQTTLSEQQWFNLLSEVIDQNDRILITRVIVGYSGWLDPKVVDWLALNI